jgi:hypothetical protein
MAFGMGGAAPRIIRAIAGADNPRAVLSDSCAAV